MSIMNGEKHKSFFASWIVYLFLALTFLGFLDASYLTLQHFRRASVGCVIFTGCDVVTASKYATVGPMPVALFGMIYYAAIIFGVLLYFFSRKEKIFLVVSRITVLGFFASLYFIFLQIFILRALCLYCIVSALISTALFLLGYGYKGKMG